MLLFSRLLLIASLFELMLVLYIASGSWWPWAFLLLASGLLKNSRQGNNWWAHGVAAWANHETLLRAGMIGGDKGLSVGKLIDSAPRRWLSGIAGLINHQMSHWQACYRFIILLRQFGSKAVGTETVRLSKAIHTAAIAPSGAGKGVSIVVPRLMEMDESVICIEYKGELAKLTAKMREKQFRHRVVLIDPYRVVTKSPDTFNPVDFIGRGSAHALDNCRDLADQLVIRTGEERETHWNDSAEMWITAALLAVVERSPSNHRSLQAVRDVLSDPRKLPELLKILEGMDGMARRLGSQLRHFQDKELSSVLTTANRHLRFLDTPAIEESTSTSSFDPRKLRDGKMSVFCILPPEHMQPSLIRMWMGSLMMAVVRGGLEDA